MQRVEHAGGEGVATVGECLALAKKWGFRPLA
jgi:hypothetical protein